MLGGMIGRILAVAMFGLVASAATAHAQTTRYYRADTVVELYTSQGCTQCPRANRLLGMFAREEGVLALTFPVGIWDYLGWRDTFAQPEFTDRQRRYSTALHVRGRFTPQLVFNGQNQISASYWDEARAALNQAKQRGLSGGPSISFTRLRANRVRVTIGAAARRSEADVWLAPFETGPITVQITAGSNLNRRIYHYNLVRSIERIGGWNGGSVWFERSGCTPECAVIIQEPNGGRILAAAATNNRSR